MASAPFMKMPEFHGDPVRFPGESWKSYKDKLELAYMGMVNPGAITDKQRVAHMLQGLRGKAETRRNCTGVRSQVKGSCSLYE